ncbi:MAG TPA: TIGR02281 family clan AA aspartic protease [Caulobacteraceae bacterium]|nr:TIGR02281 family clan AA aspartic protease [Caulobacteraceae bacterium]
MIRFAIVAFAAALAAVGAAQAVVSLDPNARPADRATPQLAVAQVSDPDSPPGAAALSKAADGHFWADADVDGHEVRFLVDTGASAVALTQEDARRLGIDPNSLSYTYAVATANGQAHAAQIKLHSISVGQAHVADVDAFVLDRGLETSLLGMTYLGRLSQFEATRTALILRE